MWLSHADITGWGLASTTCHARAGRHRSVTYIPLPTHSEWASNGLSRHRPSKVQGCLSPLGSRQQPTSEHLGLSPSAGALEACSWLRQGIHGWYLAAQQQCGRVGEKINSRKLTLRPICSLHNSTEK